MYIGVCLGWFLRYVDDLDLIRVRFERFIWVGVSIRL